MDRRFTVTLVIAACTWLASRPASADVITGPTLPDRDECPDGSRDASCLDYGHGGGHCAPRTCTSDEECAEGEVCEDARLCITYVECTHYDSDGGMTYDNEASVEGNCEEDGACEVGACESRRVCSGRAVFDDVGCDCAVALPGGGAGTAAGLAFIAAALALAILPVKRRLAGR